MRFMIKVVSPSEDGIIDSKGKDDASRRGRKDSLEEGSPGPLIVTTKGTLIEGRDTVSINASSLLFWES